MVTASVQVQREISKLCAIGVHAAGVTSQQCHSEAWFQCYKEEKSDWRSSLSEDNFDHLMRISINGLPLAQFDPTLAVQRFFSTPRRTHVQPYGSKKVNE